MNRLSWMMTPASTSPPATAASIDEKTMKRFRVAPGWTSEKSRCAVVCSPGSATLERAGSKTVPGRATSSGPTPWPRAPPDSSSA